MIRLLLLSAGTNACYHIAKILKQKFTKDFFLVGTDINESFLIPTFPYLDSFYKVPCIGEKGYYRTIIDICKKECIDYVLPSFDADQMLFYPENLDLAKLNIFSFGTSSNVLPFYSSKMKMYNFLKENVFLLPKKFDLQDVEDEQTYFIKPIHGVGSVGARKILGMDIKKLSCVDDYIIQEVCFEPEYTVECFVYNGHFSSVCRERIATKAGVCTKARIFYLQELNDVAKRFVEVLKVPYFFNLQFMKNSDGKFVITDVNLRTAGGMSLSYAAGWDEVSALAKIMLGKSEQEVFETLPSKISTQWVVRAYVDIVTKNESVPVVAFDFDGTLLDSRKRHQLVMDDVLKVVGIKLDTSDLVEFKSHDKNNVDFLISKGVDEAKAKEIQVKWIENIEKEKYLALDELYSDTIELLEKYKNAGYDLILVTARNNEQGLQNQLDKLNLRRYFKKIFVVPSGKDAANKKTEILKLQKAVLMVGDTASDALSAKNAGIEFQFHENGFHKKKVIEKYWR